MSDESTRLRLKVEVDSGGERLRGRRGDMRDERRVMSDER